MQLRLLLHSKFPEANEDDVLKIVGNLVYYRYMNPAIVAPDAFDVIDVSVEQQLTPEQVSPVWYWILFFTLISLLPVWLTYLF